MFIKLVILRFYTYFSLFKFNVIKLKIVFVFFDAKRDRLVTEGTFNEMYFEDCKKMKKVLSHYKCRSKLSKS